LNIVISHIKIEHTLW